MSETMLARGQLASIAQRPQLWGKRVGYTTEDGTVFDIHIPLHYGSSTVLSRWPFLVFLMDKNDGDGDSYIHWDSDSWLAEYTDGDKRAVLSNQVPFVLAIPRETAQPWEDRLPALVTAVVEVRSDLYVSIRRQYLMGVGRGADAALLWTNGRNQNDGVLPWYQSERDISGGFAAAIVVCPSNVGQLTAKWTCPLFVMVDSLEQYQIVKPIAEPDSTANFKVIKVQPRNAVPDDASNSGEGDGQLSPTDALQRPDLYDWMLMFSLPEHLGNTNTNLTMSETLEHSRKIIEGKEGYYVDTYGVGEGLQAFEFQVATMLGKQTACFAMTGTCANFSAVRAAVELASKAAGKVVPSAGPDRSVYRKSHNYASSGSLLVSRGTAVRARDDSTTVLLHWTSHLVHLTHLIDGMLQREAFSVLAQNNLFGLQVVPIGVMHKAVSYNDVLKELRDESFSPAVIVIEIPQRMNGGTTISFDDLRQLRTLCTKRKIHLHMDGARVWEALPYYGRPLQEICALFDSVYVSFYKGLGAMAGAMLAGDGAFINRAKGWRHRLGGQPFTFTPAWIDCQRVIDNFAQAQFYQRFDRIRRIVDMLKDERIVYPGGLVKLVPEVPQSCMMHVYICAPWDVVTAAHDKAKETTNMILWNRLRGVGFQSHASNGSTVATGEGSGCYFEWTIGSANMQVDLSEIVEGWNTFLDCLQAMLQKQGVVTPSRPVRVSRSPSRIFIQKNLLKQWAAGEELTVPLENAEPVPAVEAAEARPEWMPVSTSGSLNAMSPGPDER